jgi:uncharacterized protein with beta-barrel porin domain
MPKSHRYRELPEVPLQPMKPVPDVSITVQSEHMRELRQLQNNVAQDYWSRDDRMAAFALGNTLSREDMAVATGLAKSRIDQILREVAARYAEHRRNSGAERIARHAPS